MTNLMCSLPSPTDSRGSPSEKDLSLQFCTKFIWTLHGLIWTPPVIHLESKWPPDGLGQRRKILSSPQDSGGLTFDYQKFVKSGLMHNTDL
jgi:hypothetical protein